MLHLDISFKSQTGMQCQSFATKKLTVERMTLIITGVNTKALYILKVFLRSEVVIFIKPASYGTLC